MADVPPVRVALVNDSPIVVHGLRSLLRPFAHRVRIVDLVVGRGGRPRPRVDVALLDGFGVEDVAQRVKQVAADEDAARIAVFSWTYDPEVVEAATQAGAAGYLSKQLDAAALVDVLERIRAGERVVAAPVTQTERRQDRAVAGADWPGRAEGLSEREAEILLLIARGLTNDGVARAAYLSINTVKSYIRSAYNKMGVSSRSQAVLWAVDHGFLDDRAQRHFDLHRDDPTNPEA